MALHRRRGHRSDGLQSSHSKQSDNARLLDAVAAVSLTTKAKDSSPTSSPAASKNENPNNDLAKSNAQSFHVTKFIILRLVGAVYFIAFVAAYNQNRGLMGTNGLVPAHKYLDQLRQRYDTPIQGFLSHPSIYWFIGSSLEDWQMDSTAFIGLMLSFAVVLGLDSWLAMFLLWILDFSIVTSAEGNSFYAYGWESQLLETGFLAMFLCDLPTFKGTHVQSIFRDTNSPSKPLSIPVLWLFRWLCARISIGAGLIKLRGGQCWQDKTCLYYHFETQPVPSPLSFIFHFLPKSVLRRAVDLDFFVQMHSIWMVLIPGFNLYLTTLRRIGGFIQAGFMVNILLSGNFSILNHLTIIPALACLDDDCYPSLLKDYVHRRGSLSSSGVTRTYKMMRHLVDLCLLTLIGMLSVPVVTNLLQVGGKRQSMNASFSSFKLVNTYGAFGSVGEARYEPIISVSSDGSNWTELELPCKPGNITRRPCFCAPYHYRLDWNIWFIGFEPHQNMLQRREQWVYELMYKMLDTNNANGERPWLALLDRTSADLLKENQIKYAKVDMYRYRMANPLWTITGQWLKGEEVIWWKREYKEVLIPPIQMNEGQLAYAPL